MFKHNTNRTRVATIILLSFMLVFALISSASAEPLAKLTKIDAGILGSGTSAVFIVTVTAPETTPLPAQIPLAIPAGSTIMWCGEISGTGNENDIELAKPAAPIETRNGYDIYLLTASTYRSIAIETAAKGSFITPAAGGAGSALFNYTPAVAADMLTLGVEVPAGAVMDTAVGYASLGSGVSGTMYGTTFAPAEADKPYEMAYTYTTPTGTTGASSNSSFLPIMIVLGIGLVILAIALIVIINRQKQGASDSSVSASSAHEKPRGKNQTYGKQGGTKKGGAKKAKKNAPAPRSKPINWASPKVILTIVIVVAGIAALVFAGITYSNQVTFAGGIYTQEFAGGDPCAEASYNLTEAAIANPEAAAADIFKQLRQANLALLRAGLDTNKNTLTVYYCESNEQPAKIDAAVQATGYVTGPVNAPTGSIIATPTP